MNCVLWFVWVFCIFNWCILLVNILNYPNISAPQLGCDSTSWSKIAIRETDTALIMEPWVYGDWTGELYNNRGTMLSAGHGIAAIFCIIVRNITHAFPLSMLRSRLWWQWGWHYTRGGSKSEVVFTLMYLPYDSNPPPPNKGFKGSCWPLR